MKSFWKKIALAVLSALFCFLALELAARRRSKVPLTYLVNFVETRVSLMKSVFPAQYDSKLGWIPRPGDYTDVNYWSVNLRILEHGVRSNGGTNAVDRRPLILAVGDSFTFGSQVGDEHTWPAALERLSGARVINGGVFAYGLDQIVLRAEHLAELFKPDMLVVSFIADDVNRCERAVRTGAAKPYFDIEDGGLQLRNVPVPRLDEERKPLGWMRRILGYSYLLDAIMRRTGREAYWYLGDWGNERAHARGMEVADLLMKRLSALAKQRRIKVIVLAQYANDHLLEWQPPESLNVLKSAMDAGLSVLDLYPGLYALGRRDPLRYRTFFNLHMTKQGNEHVAVELNAYLRDHRMLP